MDWRPAWNAACEAVGLPHMLFHDLPRSGARNFRRAGVGHGRNFSPKDAYRLRALINCTFTRTLSPAFCTAPLEDGGNAELSHDRL
jgi:hypothetical protein